MLRKLTNSRHFVTIAKYCSEKNFSNKVHTFPLRHINVQHLRNARTYSQICAVEVTKMPHTPVMANEVLQYLEPTKGKVYVDMTFGAGGHSMKILESAPDVKIFALDRDPVAYEYAQRLSEKYPGQLIPLLGKFSELPELFCKHKIKKNSIDGFLFDFGCSSMQFDIGGRGFSLAKNGPLDMRMDGSRFPHAPTAADVLERIDEEDLYRVLKVYGEEKRAKSIARAIIEARYTFRNLKTTHELAELVQQEVGEIRHDKLGKFQHCATKTFQAIRILVNNELNELNYGIVLAGSYLKINGRLITISFHSLEDTIVKRHISGNITDYVANQLPLKYANYGKFYESDEIKRVTETPWKMLHKHILVPKPEEVNENPRSRSAKFRAIAKVK